MKLNIERLRELEQIVGDLHQTIRVLQLAAEANVDANAGPILMTLSRGGTLLQQLTDLYGKGMLDGVSDISLVKMIVGEHGGPAPTEFGPGPDMRGDEIDEVSTYEDS